MPDQLSRRNNGSPRIEPAIQDYKSDALPIKLTGGANIIIIQTFLNITTIYVFDTGVNTLSNSFDSY